MKSFTTSMPEGQEWTNDSPFVRIGSFVHLVLNSEHVICHTATSDAANTERDESLRWMSTASTVVTCPECTEIARICRGVRFLEKS